MMTRRAALSAPLLLNAQAALDRYHGWTGLKFAATGHFRLEHQDRWWLVTPDGHPFLSLSLNHLDPVPLRQSYNEEHWRKQFAADGFENGFRARAEADLKRWGFNGLGCHSPARRFWQPSRFPYIETFRTVEIDNWRIEKTPPDDAFHDVFAPAFEAHCEKRAEAAQLREAAKDPYLIGYTFTDVPVLTERDAAPRQVSYYFAPRAGVSTWPRVLRNLGGAAPGKQAWIGFIRERYAGDLHSFNRAYGTGFGSFDALANARYWRPAEDAANQHEVRDNAAFLAQILDRYCATMVRVIRRHDPHHLILGDKWNGNNGVPESLIATAAKHVDVIFYQWYGLYGEQASSMDEWSRLTRKPLFNGDSSYCCPDANMPRPLGPAASSQQERGAWTLDFGRRAFARPDFVGWSWCGWIDTWNTMPGKEVRQHSGLHDPFGRAHAPMQQAISELSRDLYRIATRGK